MEKHLCRWAGSHPYAMHSSSAQTIHLLLSTPCRCSPPGLPPRSIPRCRPAWVLRTHTTLPVLERRLFPALQSSCGGMSCHRVEAMHHPEQQELLPTVSPIAFFPAVTAASTSAPLAFHQDNSHYISVSTSPVVAAPVMLTAAIPACASVSPLIISTSSVISTLLTGASGSPSVFSASALSVVVSAPPTIVAPAVITVVSYDVHIIAYTLLFRIVNKFHQEVFSDPTEWAERFERDSDHSDAACEFHVKLLLSYTNYARLVMFSFGFQHAFQRGLEADDEVFFTRNLESAKTVVTVLVDSLVPTGYIHYALDGALFVFVAFASAFMLKLLRPECSRFITPGLETEVH
ncbi:hypothetical protein F5148DRAFT_1315053 [Russula earlei]|uniref:Uncharacterized protein n=1 Tax=Russula earlei TaxID=71964 RepID=A0ACC0ULQ4_9AGAM|nr:hypothetical protein F5148DRAFT_1315053 [Russula earlei]